MKVYVGYDKDDIYIEVVPVHGMAPLRFDLATEQVATDTLRQLIARELEELFGNRIETIRRMAYNRGRQSTRDKDKKVEDFNRCINDLEVGW